MENNGSTTENGAVTGAQQTQQTQTQQTATPESIAEALISAIEQKNRRNESSITHSFAEQYGMSEDEVKAVLAAEKQRRAEAIPPAYQQKIDAALERANERLIAADITAKALVMGAIDPEAVTLLINRSNIAVDDNGAVTGTDEALAALKEAKAYLFSGGATETPRQQGSTGLQHGTDAAGEDEAAIRRALGLK